MKHSLRVVFPFILFALIGTGSMAQAPSVVISFDNPVPGPVETCDSIFTEEGIPMQFFGGFFGCGVMYDESAGEINLALSSLSIDVSGLGAISKVEVDILDLCGDQCTNAALRFMGNIVAIEANIEFEIPETIVLDNAALASVDEITLDSGDGTYYEVRIYEASGCAEPTGLMATPVVTAAAISWSAVATATEYVLQYRAMGAPNWISVSSSGTSLTLTGLLSSMSYEYQVQAICDEDMSSFSPVAMFTTTNNGGCMDSDSDGICDVVDQCQGFDDNIDRDGNGIPDHCDDCDFERMMTESQLQGDTIVYETIQSVTSTQAINSGADIVFKAGNFVSLEAGFNVIMGTEFEVLMQGCSPPTR